jgi:surfactin synthase thioesterase subunit/acyl carrier protein
LGEIEKVLQSHEAVQAAVVCVQQGALCGFVLRRQGSAGGEDASERALFGELEALCRAQLTEYMVPRHWATIAELPLSANGKVARDRLPSLVSADGRESDGGDVKLSNRTVSAFGLSVLALIGEVLRVSPDTLNLESTFFAVGGNSLTAIQLLFSLRSQLRVNVSVQELFSVASVRALIDLAEERRSQQQQQQQQQQQEVMVANVQLDVTELWLSPVSRERGLLVLFNPAGASGLCYMDLVSALSPYFRSVDRVVVVDDGAVAHGRPFLFKSIDAVADAAVSLLQQHGLLDGEDGEDGGKLVLGGWSYGGVVAYEVAQRLSKLGSKRPQALVLFDAPLEASVVDEPYAAEGAANQSDTDDSHIVSRANNHFELCTQMLTKYHEAVALRTSVPPCTVIDCRPVEASLLINQKDSALVKRFTVEGSHWTMLYGQNALSLAAVLEKLDVV